MRQHKFGELAVALPILLSDQAFPQHMIALRGNKLRTCGTVFPAPSF